MMKEISKSGGKIKKRKLHYFLGNLTNIEIPNDWRKCKGMIAKRTETNSFFGYRDYSIECKCSHELMVVEGYWIWWCDTHNQPLYKCEINKLGIKVEELENRIENAKKELNLSFDKGIEALIASKKKGIK